MKAILKNTWAVLDKKEKKQFSILIGLDILISIRGGQRQRIAVARALCKDAELPVLDQPFSELHEESECILLENLKHLAQAGKMVLLVTHSTKSLSSCNKLIVL